MPWDYSDCPATGITWHTRHDDESMKYMSLLNSDQLLLEV